MPQSSVTLAKAALRAEMKARRAALSPEARQGASQAIAELGLELVRRHAGAGAVVGGFMPIGEEISPLPLMGRLAAAGYRVKTSHRDMPR